jgi:hypothetical protein
VKPRASYSHAAPGLFASGRRAAEPEPCNPRDRHSTKSAGYQNCERAGLAATVYTISHLSMSVPTIAAGIVAACLRVVSAVITVGAFVVLVAVVAAVLTVRPIVTT